MPTLWLDTNVIFGAGVLKRLAKLAKAKGVAVVIHPQAHLERCRQVREDCARKGRTFSQQVIDDLIDQLNDKDEAQRTVLIGETSLNKPLAERWADLLHSRYPTKDEWKRAKLATLRGKLATPEDVPAGKVPMTTDWLIALEVEQRAQTDPGVRVAVEDEGEEWRSLKAEERALTIDAALSWLESLPNVGQGTVPTG